MESLLVTELASNTYIFKNVAVIFSGSMRNEIGGK